MNTYGYITTSDNVSQYHIMKNKKRNNLVCKRGSYYYRLMVWTGTRQKEVSISLKTKKRDEALRRGDIIKADAHNIKDGTIQRFQFKERFPWLNNKCTSELIEMTLEVIIPEYLTYKEAKLRAKSVKRDRCSLNQLCDFIGYCKPVTEIDYLHIEGKRGLINHLQQKGLSNNGINITLRHLRTFFNWMYKKAKVIEVPIEFDMLPKDAQEYFIDEYQIQAIHDYIDDEKNGIDSFFKRALKFYEFSGVRALEPMISELYGDWLYIDASKSKGKNLRKVHLSEELKAILLEIHAFRDKYVDMGSSEPNERACERISKTLLKITRSLNFDTNRKISLKSFRHHYGIRRVYETNGNIFQVAMEMGHTDTKTTHHYLQFQPDEIKQYFPSLTPIIENMENVQKSSTMGTKTMGTIYSKDNKLQGSIGEVSS